MPALDQFDPAQAKLDALVADDRLPARYHAILRAFFESYRAAQASDPPAPRDPFPVFLDLLAAQLDTPFAFAPFHERVTAPFDHHAFGIEFIRPIVDRQRSSLLGADQLRVIVEQLAAGDNVVFFANHQAEGDPQVIAMLLDDEFPALGRELIFVAGERVTTDPLAVPFSMGCNLLCVYSKRYIEQPPELKSAKQAHNRRAMELACGLFAEGGKSLYVAPSGGRDRRNTDGDVELAPFDAKNVEMFQLIARRSGRPCHFYPMAIATYDFLPPPESIQVELGEARPICRTGVHVAVGRAIDMDAFPGHATADRRGSREARARFIWERVRDEYARLT